MFGIVRPCRHRLTIGMRAEWMAHLCGLCLALRGECGQFARVATNYDGLIVSVLTEAQSERTGGRRRSAGPCPLRRMHGASVARGEGARLAATVSLVLASAKVRDHVADRDGLLGNRPLAAAASRVARNWGRAGVRSGNRLGFDAGVLLEAVERQPDIERATLYGSPLLAVTEPTETATGAAFAHTAVLAGRPGNAGPLDEAGRLFGRLAHLLDAVEDLAQDAATGAWNPVSVTGTDVTEVRRLCDDAVHGVRLALQETEFTDGRLVRALLGPELERAVHRAFAAPRGRVERHGIHSAGPLSPLRLLPAAGDVKSGTGQARSAGTGCAVVAFLGGRQLQERAGADGPGPVVAQNEGVCPGCGQWQSLCEDCGECGECRTCGSDNEAEPVDSGGESDGGGDDGGGGPGGPGSEAAGGDDGGCCDCDCCDCDCGCG